MIIVYMATNSINGKRYIGITCQGLSVRQSRHFSSALRQNSQTHFHRAIRRHGRGRFSFEVLFECQTFDEAKRTEVNLIEKIKSEYNMTRGGDGCLGWRATPEQCRLISERNRGKPGFWKGKKLPAHVLKKLSARNLEPDRVKAWTINGALGPLSNRRHIVCLNDGLKYESISDASKFYGIDESSISKICNKRRKTASGWVFRYFGEHLGGVAEAIQLREIAKKNQLRALNSSLRSVT